MILLKTNKNESWQFFYEPGRGICQKRGTHIPQILYPDGTPDFDVACDELGQIHLITSNRAHDLVYFIHDRRNWQQFVILRSRGKAIPGNFRLIPVGRWQNLFYSLTLEDRTLLIHHILDSPSEPQVLEQIQEPFICAASAQETLCVFYRLYNGGLYAREYRWNQKEWDAPKPISLEGAAADCLYLPGSGFHFLSFTEEQMTYLGREPLTIEAHTTVPPLLSYVDRVLWIIWEENGQIRACRSEDEGAHFDAPTRFLSAAGTRDFSIRPTHFPHVVCNRALGSMNDDFLSLSVIGKRFSEPFPAPKPIRQAGQEVEEFADADSLREEIARLRSENDALKKTLHVT